MKLLFVVSLFVTIIVQSIAEDDFDKLAKPIMKLAKLKPLDSFTASERMLLDGYARKHVNNILTPTNSVSARFLPMGPPSIVKEDIDNIADSLHFIQDKEVKNRFFDEGLKLGKIPFY